MSSTATYVLHQDKQTLLCFIQFITAIPSLCLSVELFSCVKSQIKIPRLCHNTYIA